MWHKARLTGFSLTQTHFYALSNRSVTSETQKSNRVPSDYWILRRKKILREYVVCLPSEVLFAALVRVRSKHLARWYRVYCSFNQRNFQSRSILRYLSGSSYPESSYLHIACNFRLIFTNLSNTCFVRLQIVH